MPKPIPLPENIRLAGVNYALSVENPSGHLRHRNRGAIDHTTAAVVIDGTEPAWRQRTTLLHELVHGADRMYGHNSLSEERVEALENGLWAIFNDNPGLARSIFQENA